MYQYCSITSLYQVHEKVVDFDFIVAHDVGDLMLIRAGILTLNGIVFLVITSVSVFSHDNILIVNRYLQVAKSFSVIVQELSQNTVLV